MVSLVAFVRLGSGDGEQTYLGLWFLPFWHRGIPDFVLWLVVLWLVVLFVPVEPPLVVVFLCVCGFGCWGFPCFPLVFCPFLSDLFPWTS